MAVRCGRQGSGAGVAVGTAAGCTPTWRSAPSSASPPAAPAARPTRAVAPHSRPGTGSTAHTAPVMLHGYQK